MKSSISRRFWVLPLGTCVAIAAIVAASAASGSAAGPTPLAKGNYTLTVFADQNWVLPAEMTEAANFKKLTGITVKYDIVPDSTYQTLLQTKLSAGEQPGDIYMGQPPGGTGSGLQTEFQVTKHAVDLSKQPWVKQGVCDHALHGHVQRQALRSNDLGHDQRQLGHRLQQG